MSEANATAAAHTSIVWRARRYLFRLERWWLFTVRPRVARVGWLAERLPWRWWCRLVPSDADAVVRELGRRSPRPLCVVQVGANDGVLNDPLHETIRARNWEGVLVEPVPRLFERLVANYAGVPGLRFAPVAIDEREGRRTMYMVRPQSGDPDWVEQIASFDRDVMRTHAYALADFDSRIVEVDVECITFATLVERYGLRSIDLLHIDAEGFDDRIIEQLQLDAGWAPNAIIFEKKHLGLDRYRAVKDRLRAAGYRFVNVLPDEVAYRSPPDPASGRR
jgi:FkbM family methyltransferase